MLSFSKHFGFSDSNYNEIIREVIVVSTPAKYKLRNVAANASSSSI
jgi:hypothetical protein